MKFNFLFMVLIVVQSSASYAGKEGNGGGEKILKFKGYAEKGAQILESMESIDKKVIAKLRNAIQVSNVHFTSEAIYKSDCKSKNVADCLLDASNDGVRDISVHDSKELPWDKKSESKKIEISVHEHLNLENLDFGYEFSSKLLNELADRALRVRYSCSAHCLRLNSKEYDVEYKSFTAFSQDEAYGKLFTYCSNPLSAFHKLADLLEMSDVRKHFAGSLYADVWTNPREPGVLDLTQIQYFPRFSRSNCTLIPPSQP